MRGPLLILGAAVLWSLSGVVLKTPAFETLPSENRGLIVAALRASFATAVLLPFVRLRSVRWRWGLLPMVIAFAAMNALFISAMLSTTAAAAIFLQYTSTIFACLIGWFWLREQPSRHDLLALLPVASGIGLIVVSDGRAGSWHGNALALGSGLAYGFVVVCLRILRTEDSAWLTFLNHFATALFLLPLVAWQLGTLLPIHWMLIAFLGIFQMALPYVLFTVGVREVSAREAAVLLLIEPVLNPLWVVLVWREPVPNTTWIGGAFLLCGLLLRFVRSRVPREPLARPAAPVRG